MSPALKLTLMSAFLVYVAIRAAVYFRSKRPQFGIAVLFVASIVVYEMVRTIMQLASDSS